MQFLQFRSFKGTHALHADRFWRALFMVRSNNTFAIGIPGPYRPGFSAHRFRAVLNNSARLQALSKARPYLKNAFCSGVIFIFGLLFWFKIFACRNCGINLVTKWYVFLDSRRAFAPIFTIAANIFFNHCWPTFSLIKAFNSSKQQSREAFFAVQIRCCAHRACRLVAYPMR